MGSSQSRQRKRREKSLRFQLTNLEKAILDSEDNEALVWLSRILVMSTGDQVELCKSVSRLLVRIAAEDVNSQDEEAFKLAAAVWVCVRESFNCKKLCLSARETLALATIFMARTDKSRLVHEALTEAQQRVAADGRCCGLGCGGQRRGGGVGAFASARGSLFSAEKLSHSIDNIRMFLLRSDMENSLYWLAQTLRHIRRLSRKNSPRRHMVALHLASFLRGFAHDFVDDEAAEDVADAAFSVLDFAPNKYEACGDLSELESVLALVVVKLAQAAKGEFVQSTVQTVLRIKRRMEATGSASMERGSASRKSLSIARNVSEEDSRKKKRQPKNVESKGSRVQAANGEDMSLFQFETVKGWLQRRRPQGGSGLRKPKPGKEEGILISTSHSREILQD